MKIVFSAKRKTVASATPGTLHHCLRHRLLIHDIRYTFQTRANVLGWSQSATVLCPGKTKTLYVISCSMDWIDFEPDTLDVDRVRTEVRGFYFIAAKLKNFS